MRRLAISAACLGVASALGCASAYDRTYEAELGRLEAEQADRDAAERAAHDAARRYAAVVYFDLGSSDLGDESRHELRWLVDQLAPYPEAILQVQGFADATGSEPRNAALSVERAERVAGYLMELGVDASRIRTQGFASSFPAEPNETAQGRSRNRRVEVTVL